MRRILLALAVAMFLAGSLFAQNSKLDQVLNDKVQGYKTKSDKGKEKIRVIVKTIPSLSQAGEAESKRLGGKEIKKFSILSAHVTELPVAALEQLAKNPAIHSISFDSPMKSSQVV